jgi:glycosyltransferase involved in cell wall biosynthesis
MNNTVLADGRWQGTHGIGRFSYEILSRLHSTDILTYGPRPLSIQNLFWLPRQLHKSKHKIFFNPGFNPVLHSKIPFIFTIHDLIHLQVPGKFNLKNTLYYELLIKYSAKKAYKIVTVSEYSKQCIAKWANIPEEKIIVAGNGISACFNEEGDRHTPEYPYLLHVGNTKPHKNVARLLEAFAIAKIDNDIKLILTGNLTKELHAIIKKHRLKNEIIFSGVLSDEKLAEYYRGAQALLLPSLIEGFGIPVIEAMACGTPVLTANTTSLPEVAGSAALLVDPYHTESIAQGIKQIVENTLLKKSLIEKGLLRAQDFSWDKIARIVQQVLQI